MLIFCQACTIIKLGDNNIFIKLFSSNVPRQLNIAAGQIPGIQEREAALEARGGNVLPGSLKLFAESPPP